MIAIHPSPNNSNSFNDNDNNAHTATRAYCFTAVFANEKLYLYYLCVCVYFNPRNIWYVFNGFFVGRPITA